MNKVYVGLAVLGAIALVTYLASKRQIEVHATVTAEEPTITYRSDEPITETYVDNHQRLVDLVEESNRRIAAFDAENAN